MSNRGMPSSSSGPSVEDIYRALMQMEFTESTFPDAETLGTLGILEQVKAILKDMGISSILTIEFEAHQKPTCMFLASLEVFYSEGTEGDENGGGFISFQNLRGRTERFTFRQLETIYGFNCQRFQPDVFESVPDEIQIIWDVIGSKDFRAGRTKNSCIRHPAVRYVQQILANSFFSRRDTSTVLAEEMDFLRLGIERHVCNTLQTQALFHNVYKEKPCPLKIFLQQLLKFKDLNWIAREGTTPQIRIGGWITPILQLTQAPLGRNVWTPRLMDINYLGDIQYIVGNVDAQFCYQFRAWDNTKAIVLLPNSRRTTFRRHENLPFKHDTSNTREIVAAMTNLESCSDNLSNLSLDEDSSNSQTGGT